MKEVGSETPDVSIEAIIENVRAIRDGLITRLLKDDELRHFLETHYNIFAMSTIRVEFLKRDLRELKGTSLDLVHYSSLIKYVKEARVEVSPDHPLFLAELRGIFEKVRG